MIWSDVWEQLNFVFNTRIKQSPLKSENLIRGGIHKYRWEFTLLLDEENKPAGIQCLGVDNTEAIVQKELQFILNQINAYINGVEDFPGLWLITTGEFYVPIKHLQNWLAVVIKNWKAASLQVYCHRNMKGDKELHKPDIFIHSTVKKFHVNITTNGVSLSFPKSNGNLIVIRDITNTIKVKEDLLYPGRNWNIGRKMVSQPVGQRYWFCFAKWLPVKHNLCHIICDYHAGLWAGRINWQTSVWIHSPEDVDTAMFAFGELFQQKTRYSFHRYACAKKRWYFMVMGGSNGKNKFDDPLIQEWLFISNDINVRKKAEGRTHSQRKEI